MSGHSPRASTWQHLLLVGTFGFWQNYTSHSLWALSIKLQKVGIGATLEGILSPQSLSSWKKIIWPKDSTFKADTRICWSKEKYACRERSGQLQKLSASPNFGSGPLHSYYFLPGPFLLSFPLGGLLAIRGMCCIASIWEEPKAPFVDGS